MQRLFHLALSTLQCFTPPSPLSSSSTPGCRTLHSTQNQEHYDYDTGIRQVTKQASKHAGWTISGATSRPKMVQVSAAHRPQSHRAMHRNKRHCLVRAWPGDVQLGSKVWPNIFLFNIGIDLLDCSMTKKQLLPPLSY